jgi:hypothetical protein
MAWNGSDGAAKPRKVEKKPSAWRGLLAAVIVIGGAAGVCLFLFGPATVVGPRVKDKAKTAKIADATPEVAPTVQEAPKEPTVDPDARPTKVGEVVNGYVMLPSGRIHKPTGVVTNRVADYARSKYSIFEKRSDNEIAAIIMMKPGDTLVGTKRYDTWFTRQFLESLNEPIAFSDDDEPWQVELKNMVIQARNELKEAYDNGEDIDELMSESRQQLQDLSRYKQQIRQLYAQNLQECETEEHLEELQRAVNIMLEEKGCAPIDFTPLTKLNLMKGQSDE